MSLWQTILSVLQAFFGVQSPENHERDFKHGNPILFLIIGYALTILFILSLYLIVTKLIL